MWLHTIALHPVRTHYDDLSHEAFKAQRQETNDIVWAWTCGLLKLDILMTGFFVEKFGDFISSKEMFNEPRNFRATLLTVHLQPVVAVVRSNHPYPLILTKVRM